MRDNNSYKKVYVTQSQTRFILIEVGIGVVDYKPAMRKVCFRFT